ncbi:MAG: hypothetical protein HY869_04625 [Chloroflexi bacterium]|nr:hypothetical protein [Chloroflexota bacterium]
MTAYRKNVGDGLLALFKNRRFNRGAAWGVMIIGALLAFEIFNFSTTQFALLDMLGDLKFAGMRWASVLAVAFCGIDFAGIARIFTPEQGRDEPTEVWYLFGAWLLAAAFNAGLTWWGVSVAITTQGNVSGSAAISTATMTKAVPVIVAVMVWLIRVLIIGTFSLAGDRLFTTDHNTQRNNYTNHRPTQQSNAQPVLRPASQLNRPAAASNASAYRPPAPKPAAQQTSFARPEPTYHPVNFSERNNPTAAEHYDA